MKIKLVESINIINTNLQSISNPILMKLIKRLKNTNINDIDVDSEERKMCISLLLQIQNLQNNYNNLKVLID